MAKNQFTVLLQLIGEKFSTEEKGSQKPRPIQSCRAQAAEDIELKKKIDLAMQAGSSQHLTWDELKEMGRRRYYFHRYNRVNFEDFGEPNFEAKQESDEGKEEKLDAYKMRGKRQTREVRNAQIFSSHLEKAKVGDFAAAAVETLAEGYRDAFDEASMAEALNNLSGEVRRVPYPRGVLIVLTSEYPGKWDGHIYKEGKAPDEVIEEYEKLPKITTSDLRVKLVWASSDPGGAQGEDGVRLF